MARPRLYEAVERELVRYVRRAGMVPGDRLPSERELAERLGISRVTLRQATVSLEVQGILEVRHGGGIYLRALQPDPQLSGRLLARRQRLPEVLEAREILECRLAALAAVRRDDTDLRDMEAALAVMADEVAVGELGIKGDAAFHEAVTAAARNAVLAHLMGVLAEQIAESRTESLSEPGRPPRSLAAHRRILAAIRAGDSKQAERAMRRHLQQVADVRLLRWQPAGDGSGPGAGPGRDL